MTLKLHILPFFPKSFLRSLMVNVNEGLRCVLTKSETLLVMYGVHCGLGGFLLVCTICIAVNILYI